MDIPQSPALDGPQRYHDSLVNPPEDFENPVPPVTPLSAQQFLAIVDEVRAAIDEGIYPTLISQGSSGSYFCKNRQGQIVGVFKPKNEEPYGHLNPKWTKWIHKNLFPCCFGRSCIIPNLGYISEAAASYIDRRLKLNVVPRTEVVYLAAPTFYYSRKDWKLYRKGETLPEKVGSFQVFLNGYKDATRFFREGYEKRRRASSVNTSARNSSENLMSGSEHGRSSDNLNRPPSDNANGAFDWSELSQKQFQWGFERLVVLDYLIRNTDRGLDNWMVKFDESRDEAEKAKQRSATPTPDEDPEEDPIIQVAAIDNGLAFPWKHPDRWRSYPYGWAYLPAARIPFSRETRILVLHLLTSPSWWRETMEGLEKLFRIDSDFSESMWRKQRAVVRGEGYNLVETLRRSEVDGRGGSPWGLIRRPVVAVYEEEILDEGEDGEADMARWAEGVLGGPSAGMRPGRRRSFVERQSRRFAKRVRQRFETFARSRPCFENW
ncbi:phosphatidylinositol 3 and 4-kinase-domain-containing protein [Phlyctochytrium arcticum]|nr:phosphatidylinositol 3 and 4-kinase-domain-containing protein [Phlyctochytrium arcticum]